MIFFPCIYTHFGSLSKVGCQIADFCTFTSHHSFILQPQSPAPSSEVSFTKQPRKLTEQCCRNHCPVTVMLNSTAGQLAVRWQEWWMTSLCSLEFSMNPSSVHSPHQLDPNSRNSFQSQTANVGVAWRHIIFCEWAIISNEILPINPKPSHTARFLHLQLCPIDQYLACYPVLIGEGDGGNG